MLNNKQIQMNLQYLGLYNGAIDGIIGSGSKAGIREFQKRYGLQVDGIYGRVTDYKLIEVIKQEQRNLGVTADGVAGPITINARNNKSITWNDIKYFKKSEFTCKCGCGLNNIDLKIVKIADDIRGHFGKPCIVNSGTRCVIHNKIVGGVSNSRHLTGKAIDMVINGVSGNNLLAYTKQLVAQGKLRYTYLIGGNAVHIDIQ